MKTQNPVSQLTLELYYRGLATRKETKQVEKALLADAKVRERYETLKQQEREINQFITKEWRLNIPETPPVSHGVIPVWGFAAAAAILICAGIPLFFYLKNKGANKNNAVAENAVEETAVQKTAPENEISEETRLAEPETAPVNKTPSVEQPTKKEKTAQTPNKETKPNSTDFQPAGTEIAAVPTPDTGVRMRGGDQPKDQRGSAAAPEQVSNLNIPPGITFIFENMFANKQLSYAVIPGRITSIGKNAFAGNPLLAVTIGANVDVDAEAIPGNFAKAYNANGKAAGVYMRPNNHSEEWVKEN